MVDVSIVTSSDMCNGCGICYSACPTGAIDMKYNKKLGTITPFIDDNLCIDCSLCVRSCPSVGIRRPQDLRELIGHYISIRFGYSTNNFIRERAASGGIATTLLIHLLETGKVDGVITFQKTGDPLIFEPVITRDIDEILDNMGSKYLPIPVGKALKRIREVNGKFAIVGSPCLLEGVDKLAMIDPRIRKKIHLKVGFFCGGLPTINAILYYMQNLGIPLEGLTNFYRGIGWPGKNVFEYSQGKITVPRRPRDRRVREVHLAAFFPMITHKRCLLCNDRFARHADISLGDAWVPQYEGKDEKGVSLIVSRTTLGERYIIELAEERKIYIKAADVGSLVQSQSIFFKYWQNFRTTKVLLWPWARRLIVRGSGGAVNPLWAIFLSTILITSELGKRKRLWWIIRVFSRMFDIIRYLGGF